MSFSREDLVTYATQPQVQVENHDPWVPVQADAKAAKIEIPPQVEAEADVNAAIDASITEPTEKGINDGSTTEQEAEPVAAEIANPEGAKDPELEEPADGRNRSRAQERIEELVAERNALRKYGEYLLGQVEGQRKAPKTESQPVQPQVQEDVAPTLESADFDPIKLNKLTNEWLQKQVDARVASAVRQIETRQTEQATRQAFEQRTVEFKKSVSDFELVISNPALPQLAPDAARVLVKSQSGPAVLYHLGKNPDLAARIARMDSAEQSAAIGRIEEQLSRVAQKEPSKEVPKPAIKQASVTKAPPPLKPVSGGSSVVRDSNAPMSMEDWVANERNKKLAERSERKKLRLAMR